jgi:hypothetical protein
MLNLLLLSDLRESLKKNYSFKKRRLLFVIFFKGWWSFEFSNKMKNVKERVPNRSLSL